MKRLGIMGVLGVLLVLMAGQAWGTNYYVSSSTGNDTWAGIDPSAPFAHHPWDTNAPIGSVCDNTVLAHGDTVFTRYGDVWYTNTGFLNAYQSGTSGDPIVTMPKVGFGTGANPSFIGSAASYTWTQATGTAYYTTGISASDSIVVTWNGQILCRKGRFSVSTTEGAITGSTLISGQYCVWVNAAAGTDDSLFVDVGADPATGTLLISRVSNVVSINSKNYVEFNNISFSHSKGSNGVVYLLGTSAGVKFRNCAFKYGQNALYVTATGGGNLVDGCDVRYMGTSYGATNRSSGNGIWLSGSDGNTYTRNTIVGSFLNGSLQNGFYVSNADANDFSYNDVSACWDGIDYRTGGLGAGYFTLGSAERNIIRHNRFHDNCTNVKFSQTSGGGGDILYSNLVDHALVNDVTVYAYGMTNPICLYNNTIYHYTTDGDSTALDTYAGHGVVAQTTGAGFKAANNIIYTGRSGAGCENMNGMCIANNGTPQRLDKVYTDYNFFCGVPRACHYKIDDGTSSYYATTIDSVRTIAQEYNKVFDLGGNASAGEAHSITGEPNFTNAALGDYRLLAGSIAIDAGVNDLGVITDCDGLYRLGLNDIGAFEYGGSATPPTAHYVDATSGHDTWSGLSAATAWKTIAKADSAAVVLAGGASSILFKRGEVWRETLTVPKDSLTFGAYESGAKPVISGAEAITGSWTVYSTGGTVTSDIAAANDNYTAYLSSSSWSNGILLSGKDATAGTNIGLRFALAVPQGATIDAATVKGYQTDPYSGVAKSVITAHASDNSGQVTTYAGWQTIHASLVSATPVAWDITDPAASTWYTSPSIKTIIQDIVSRPGWTSGNYLHLFIDDNGTASYIYKRFSKYGSNVMQLRVVYSLTSAVVWQKALVGEPDMVIVNGTVGTKKASLAALTSANNWYWAENVLYLYSTADPAGKTVEYATRQYAINTNGKDLLTIENLTLEGTTDWGAGIRCYQSHYVTASGCDLSRNYYYGFIGSGDSHGNMTVRDCTFSYNGGGGINSWYGGSPDVDDGGNLYTGNTFAYNGWRNAEVSPIISASDNTEYSYNIIRDNNTAANNPDYLGHNHGIYIGQPSTTGQSVHHNTVYNQGAGTGIKVLGTCNIYANHSYSNYQAGITVGFNATSTTTANVYSNVVHDNYIGIWAGLYTSGAFSLNIYNNTIYNNNNSAIDEYTAGISIPYDCQSLVIKNNIISAPTGGSSHEYSMVTQTHATIDYNLLHNNSNSIWYNAGNRTFSTWQGYGFDVHGLVADPKLKTDYTPDSGSPVINAGTPVGLTVDYAGRRILGLPDIGAYESRGSREKGYNGMGGYNGSGGWKY